MYMYAARCKCVLLQSSTLTRSIELKNNFNIYTIGGKPQWLEQTKKKTTVQYTHTNLKVDS